MPLTQEDLARRLKEAREDSGLTQSEVAEELELPRTAVTHIEAGKRAVSTLELTEFARLYMRPVQSFFEDSLGHEEEVMHVLLRVLDGFSSSKKVRVQISSALEVCRHAMELKALLGLRPTPAPPTYSLAALTSSAEAVTQGGYVAGEERRRLALGTSPIADISDLINREGVWATSTALPNEMSGVFLQHSSIGMLALVNLDHPIARKRFSYAHEFAHALLDRKLGARASTRANHPELVEKRANAFAAAFLMPRDGVLERLAYLDKGMGSRETSTVYDVNTESGFDTSARKKPGSQTLTFQDVACLCHHFGVSYAAMTYRLVSLGLVSQSQRSILLSQEDLGRDYLSSLRADSVAGASDRELHVEVARLAFEAYRLQHISRGRLLEVTSGLGISMKAAELQMHALR